MRQSSLVMVPLASIRPCPYQPRVNVSADLVRRLAASMTVGRHEPLIEVEPTQDEPGTYQIVCGEQRWRAAVEAGLEEVLVRLHARLGYLERLEKQCEENRLRKDLDPVEEAHSILLHKTLCDIARAEELLVAAAVPFLALETKKVVRREEFGAHLRELERLLVESETHVLVRDGKVRCGPLAVWRETEGALGISESARKAKIGILRLPPELQERVRHLSGEHAAQISRLTEPDQLDAVIRQAEQLTHREVHDLVDRLLQHSEGSGSADGNATAPDPQLLRLVDVCRQLSRLVGNLRPRLSPEERTWAASVVAELRTALTGLVEEDI